MNLKYIISVLIDFFDYSLRRVVKIFSIGCLIVTVVIIFFIIFIFLIVTGRFDPIPMILRWLN